MKKSLLYLFGVLFLSIACGLGLWMYALFMPVVSQDNGYIYYLRPGTSRLTALTELSQQGLIPFPYLFSFYLYLQPSTHLKTGEYRFPKGATPISIWKQITLGRGLLYRPFTIVPGWSFRQVRSELLKTEGLRPTIQSLDDKQVMTLLGYPNLAPEGEFYPETYYYTKGIADVVILKRAVDLMQKKLSAAWQNRAPGLPYKNEYEALIAASLIEKEAYLSSERPIIAGVLVNRLKKDMLLQFDPTVIYGMGDRYAGKISKENLKEDTIYNTYVHKGLPPTPIAMPSMLSIDAAMHPQQNDYYYFVAKGDGSHQFSKTLPEHHSAVTLFKQHAWYFNEDKMQKYLSKLVVKQSKIASIAANSL